MARRKNRPETVRAKYDLAERLREIRVALYGERGGSEMARRLGVPIRTWYNYESGVTVPAEVLLKFLELTSVEPQWLLHGRGERFRTELPAGSPEAPRGTVQALLRTALQHLERRREVEDRPRPVPAGDAAESADSLHGWQEAEREGRCVRVEDNGMIPIVANGAQVAFSAEDEEPADLDGALVVAWVEGRPIVRWFRLSGNYGLLRAENPEAVPNIELLDLRGPRESRRVRRVLWISTPH
jgi:transcriptional regulator with XRE-family HTH domain